MKDFLDELRGALPDAGRILQTRLQDAVYNAADRAVNILTEDLHLDEGTLLAANCSRAVAYSDRGVSYRDHFTVKISAEFIYWDDNEEEHDIEFEDSIFISMIDGEQPEELDDAFYFVLKDFVQSEMK